jgi:uncharacterized membrane protein YcjF (UPF0283 family)
VLSRLSRWQGGLAALLVTLLTGSLVFLDITDKSMRRWWEAHALTTDTVSGLLVLAITFLVVDQVVRIRQLNSRAQAIGAQALIVMAQATRATNSVSKAVADGAGQSDRDAAVDEVRTYMMMLMVGAPVLIDATVSRTFLEQAQALGGEMWRALTGTAKQSSAKVSWPDRLDHSLRRLRDASTPLLQVLDPETRAAVNGDESD